MSRSLKGRVLVTGAGGFIGSHLTERLVALGCEVRAFVRYTSSARAGFLDFVDPKVRTAIEVIRGDLRDYNAVSQAAKGAETIFHLGALIGIPYSYVHPRETVDTNVLGTLNVLLAAREASAARLIHTSSSEVYGTARHVPMRESHPLQAQSPYSASKIGADKLAESFCGVYGLPTVILRPFNTYGPRQSARAAIPTIISQALVGNTVRLGNLGPRRDLTYVADTVEGFVLAARSRRAVGRTINLGTSEAVSIRQLTEKIGSILGKRLRVRRDPVRVRPAPSEVRRLVSDNRLAADLLGWRPTVSLDEGLAKTIEWIKSHLHLYQIGRYEI